MKYFIDTEFCEGIRKPIMNLPAVARFNKPRHHLQLISIGIVSEDGRKYYAVSNEFDIDWAWNKHTEIINPDYKWYQEESYYNPQMIREYWLRENVLLKIYEQYFKHERIAREMFPGTVFPFNIRTMRNLIRWNGKSNIQIANEICEFIYGTTDSLAGESTLTEARKFEYNDITKYPEFYGYFSDYDWVAFCSLFEGMMGIPKTFPKYCIDLKQMLDEKVAQKTCEQLGIYMREKIPVRDDAITFEQKLGLVKSFPDYPKQINEHHSLADAQWNKELFMFIKSL